MTGRLAAIKVIKRLQHNGYQALLAGGCVRDMLLHRPAKDHDVATDARPDEVMKLFNRTLKVGAKFGVVVVLVDGQQSAKGCLTAVEVATFRCESGYADGRRPDSVKFTTAQEDASRRDFTINGMFYDPVNRLVLDYVGGQEDLKKRIIRTIGDPHERFSEDYLRILRAVRFSTQLGFKIEHATFAAVCKNAAKITGISGERIAVELEGILTSPNRPTGASMLIETGLAEAIFPGFVGETPKFGIAVLSRLRKKSDFALSIACFFAGCETQFALDKIQILKLSRNQNKHIKFLLTNRGKLLNYKMSLAELKKILAEPYFGDLYELQRAIEKNKQSPDREGGIALVKLRKRIDALGDVELRPRPLLNGHDLIRLGAVAGPALGQLAEELYIAQLEGFLRTREQAEHWVKTWLHRHTI